MAKQVVNNGETGLVVRNKMNENFTELYNFDSSSDLRVNQHVAGTHEKHNAADIVYDATNVDAELASLDGQIQAISVADSNATIGVYSVNVTGTDTLTAEITGLPSYFGKLKINATIENDNTGASTINVSDGTSPLGSESIKKIVNGVKVDLSPGDLQQGTIAQFEYDGTDFIVLNPRYMQIVEDVKNLNTTANTEIGVAWNQGDDDVFRVSRAKDYTRSNFDTLAPWVNIKRCILNDDTTVKHYLDATDSYNLDGVAPTITGTADSTTANKLTDAGAFTEEEIFYVGKYVKNTTNDTYAMIIAKDSNDALSLMDDIFSDTDTYELQTAILDGSDGQIMVEIPKFWYRSIKVGSVYQWYISATARTGYSVHPAFIRDSVEKDKVYLAAFEGFFNSTTAKMESRADCVPSTDNGVSDGGLSPIAAYGAIGGTNAGDIRNCRLHAQARNTGENKEWELRDFLTTSAIQLLYLVEYANFDTQTMIGRGVVDRSSGDNNNARKTGETLNLGNISGMGDGTDGNIGISYRGIENFYGNIWEWTDGLNLNDYVAFVSDHSFESDKFNSPYENVGTVLSTSDTYIKDILYNGLDYGFLASEGGGNSSSYLHDNWWVASSSRVARFGGHWLDDSRAGGFCWSLIFSSSAATRNYGSRLLCIPS